VSDDYDDDDDALINEARALSRVASASRYRRDASWHGNEAEQQRQKHDQQQLQQQQQQQHGDNA